MRTRYPKEWVSLASDAGRGLRQLLASNADLDEAQHTCQWGLLASNPPSSNQLRIAGKRLLQDTIEPLEATAQTQEPS